MRSRRLALTALAVAALAVTATACGPENSDAAAPASSPAVTTVPSAPATPSAAAPTATAAAPSATTKPSATASTATSAPSSPAASGQAAGSCGAKDLVLTAKAESQAGGYILIAAKAKPGVTCTLPARPPVIAFGSRGIEASKAEQGVSQPIKLSGSDTAYAGVMTKTTKDNQAVQFTDIIVGIGNPDPDPVSLPIGPTNVDKPIVTNWHNLPENAVPVH
ncbi:hypothetical protein ACFVUH_27350 [Kitasatospora sp. NPDC058032]|uniref:hypothetical protein n=1 Tax=Kitasatospora sp. NPDC058032 TaxID=3346307 RepID=UPI0036D79113